MAITTQTVLDELNVSFNKIYAHLRDLAPYNTTYVGIDNYKQVDYIFVENKRVRGNTNTLRNSVVQSQELLGKAQLTHKVSVSSASVPYYEKAVLSNTLTRAKHYGRLEYGNVRYANSTIEIVTNRNFEYYMQGLSFVQGEIRQYNNRKYHVSDDIKEWM